MEKNLVNRITIAEMTEKLCGNDADSDVEVRLGNDSFKFMRASRCSLCHVVTRRITQVHHLKVVRKMRTRVCVLYSCSK